jgi:predicted ATP-dependent endonuclease of OLD family
MTSPIEEGVLNGDGLLEVKKVFSFGAKTTKATFINGFHPQDQRIKDILSKKNSQLKSLAEDLGIDLTDVNKAKNPPIRQKIREFIGGERALMELKVDGNIDTEDNLKAVWSSLKKLLPVFSLFKVDKTLDDKDSDVQDPMKVAIQESLALPEIQELLEQVEAKVKEKSTEVADRTIEKMKDLDESLSERLKSDFSKSPSWNKIFDLTLLNENNIPLNKRGSGIRRLVLLSFFQAQAEKKKSENNAPAIIYAIEEPETSQHPNHQLLLIKALIRLSSQDNIQVLFTTHSANLVRELPISSLRYVSLNNHGEIQVENGNDIATAAANEEVINKIIITLGVLPNPADRVKVLVYVEGNHDVNALKRYSKIMNHDNPDIINLSTVEVGWVITGGSALKHYINNKYLSGLGKPEVHIYDNDVPEYRTFVGRINSENDPKKIAFNTSKNELENYLHHQAVIDAYADNGIDGIIIDPISDNQDVPMIVAQALYSRDGRDWAVLDPDDQKSLSTDKKKILNTQVVDKMTIERIRERGGYPSKGTEI